MVFQNTRGLDFNISQLNEGSLFKTEFKQFRTKRLFAASALCAGIWDPGPSKEVTVPLQLHVAY